ncbi:MAG: hypothetical protein NT128_01340 [Proteobacteria bacterium]|nr:hypothetical protein [Pseudomonadota bacterium]
MCKKIFFIFHFFTTVGILCASYYPNLVEKSKVKSGWSAYYHVTRSGNIDSIRSGGISISKSGDKGAKGMSVLAYDRHKNDHFIKGSAGHVYVGKSWDEAKRYSEHMHILQGEYNSFDDLPVILKCDAIKHRFLNDPDDGMALRSRENIKASKIFVLVMPLGLEDDEKDSFWLPLSDWDSKIYKPAYPENDTKCFHFGTGTVRDLLQERISSYSHNGLSKKKAAAELKVDYRTMDKFIMNNTSLTMTSIRKIVNNFCKNFWRITCYDLHFLPQGA